jgi:hypothetical protein
MILFSGNNRPPWNELTGWKKFNLIGLYGKFAFLFIKGVLFIWGQSKAAKLYKDSYGKWWRFEAVFFLVSAFKIFLVLPDTLVNEINWLFYGLALNSALVYCLSYELRSRMLKGMGVRKRSKTAKAWLWTRLGLLALVMCTPAINVFDRETAHYL